VFYDFALELKVHRVVVGKMGGWTRMVT